MLIIGSFIVLAVSEWVWKAGGKAGCAHSRLVFRAVLEITPRSATSVSQRRKINNSRAVKESIDPNEEIEFQTVYVSG